VRFSKQRRKIMENKELYERAKRRVKARLGFYTHLGIYAAVNAVLFLTNWNETGTVSFAWFTWPLVGWGICLTFHFLSVFVFRGDITERMIQREMEKERREGK
jgi:hypothetical protein